jgi:hypothetical protein
MQQIMKHRNADPTRASDWLMLALLVLPLGIALGKLPALATSAAFVSFFSLAGLPAQFHGAVETTLFVPLGALVVVIFRLTLGIQVFGLVRPILLAIAFSIAGIPLSLAFLLCTLVLAVLLRPLLNTDHACARVAVMLSLIAALLLLPPMAGTSRDIAQLREIAFFPVIALCFTCESFANTADRCGIREAAWRTMTTALAAIVIACLAKWPGMFQLFLHFPELLLAQAAAVLMIDQQLAYRLFEGMNPLEVRPSKAKVWQREDVLALATVAAATKRATDRSLISIY